MDVGATSLLRDRCSSLTNSGAVVFNLPRWSINWALLTQLLAESAWLLIAVILARWLDGQPASAVTRNLAPAILFAVIMIVLNGGFGLYRQDQRLLFAAYVGRLTLAMLIGAPIAYVGAILLPGGDRFRDLFGEIFLLAFIGLILVRHIAVSPLLRTLLVHRVMVLGTGPEAKEVGDSLEAGDASGMRLVGYCALQNGSDAVVSSTLTLARELSLEDLVQQHRVNEIIVAVREQRGGALPLRALLECRLHGIQVTDLARFFECVHGMIPIDTLKVSWLIYGHGFRQNWLRTAAKRLFDIVMSITLLLLTLPVLVITTALLALDSRAPVLYRQERVGVFGKTFDILKFRSMRPDAESDGKPAWATVSDPRVTRLGSFLRRSRIDELPQLFNVLKGEMSLVGPRPERPVFVTMLTEQIPFYGVRHSVKPGITGWAQVRYSYGANVAQSKKKLEYDLYYVKNHTLFLDLLILVETIRVVILGEGAR